VSGTYQRPDGTSVQRPSSTKLTLRNVYDGVEPASLLREQGTLEFDWLVARAQDYSKNPHRGHGQDGIACRHADGERLLAPPMT